MVFNPSSVERLVHVWLAAFILGAFFVMSISAWYMLKGRHLEFAQRSFTGGLCWPQSARWHNSPLVTSQATVVAEHQPAKLAAMEGQFKTEAYAPMHIFGWPDEQDRQTVHFPIRFPEC